MHRAPLDTLPVIHLKGVGPRVAERLTRLNIHTIQDLLFHLPYRYQDRTRIAPIGTLQPGKAAGIVGHVELTQVRYGRRRSLISMVADGTGRMLLRFFNFRTAQQKMLARGVRVHCFGDVRRGPQSLEMIHPEFRIVGEDDAVEVEAALTPSYPTTEGLHQISLRKLTDHALALLESEPSLIDHLPPSVLEPLSFPTLVEAIKMAHRPPPETRLETVEAASHPAQRRLAFEELLAHHLSLRLRRRALADQAAHPIPMAGSLIQRFTESLPFTLTDAQERVVNEIRNDLARATPMHRLVQGDVGSGKTVVAALAALQTIEAGYQVAFMAPTELLAEQHLQNLSDWLEKLGINIGWISGKLTAKTRRETLAALERHDIQLIIGTHALFQDPVEFTRLGLIVVDEQHRFGVHQRLSLLDKGQSDGKHAHQLIMTATPIPRTLAMAAYADLDTSVIDTLPPGRQPVETAVVPDTRRAEIVERVQRACGTGQQAYWVCTLIEDSEALECQAATDTAAALEQTLPELTVGLIHGRMKSTDKEAVMERFKSGDVDLLVATTVIEVGVDVPNASLMIIENAERLGLAQLHQLRGRVGRGPKKSVCVLMYHSPLSELARKRLHALRETNDGFEIARRDLELRGPGELLGTRQTGMLTFHIADLIRDQAMLPEIEKAADMMLADYTTDIPPLVRRWLGDSVSYVDV